MLVLYTMLIILVSFLVFLNTHKFWSAFETRRPGKLPQRGKGTMFDVRHLLMEGEKDLAIRLYCEIFNTTPFRARKDIAELERSLKV